MLAVMRPLAPVPTRTRVVSLRMEHAGRMARHARGRSLATAAPLAASVALPKTIARRAASLSLAHVAQKTTFPLMVLVGQTERPVRVLPSGIAVLPLDSAANLPLIAMLVAMLRLALVMKLPAVSLLTVNVARTGRPARALHLAIAALPHSCWKHFHGWNLR
ncbi:uncharacterized protein CLUP02_17833 [Colletotrichum lupini]|uniref:Uncharacterized protein n=1 Tax=Colletotrichum lupini TaxID=145971 RepID=A0A9Q8SFL6_9PEZI|nr:uncharacterized protein CLUP02_17833 [Colletotrichum lupini]UQC76320.1 hypothetical protein CLUP02_17833 [Colletotrichum lupini]